jgi:hypothetical protein
VHARRCQTLPSPPTPTHTLRVPRTMLSGAPPSTAGPPSASAGSPSTTGPPSDSRPSISSTSIMPSSPATKRPMGSSKAAISCTAKSMAHCAAHDQGKWYTTARAGLNGHVEPNQPAGLARGGPGRAWGTAKRRWTPARLPGSRPRSCELARARTRVKKDGEHRKHDLAQTAGTALELPRRGMQRRHADAERCQIARWAAASRVRPSWCGLATVRPVQPRERDVSSPCPSSTPPLPPRQQHKDLHTRVKFSPSAHGVALLAASNVSISYRRYRTSSRRRDSFLPLTKRAG